MKRWLTILIALAMVFLGIVFSAINAGTAVLDLYFFSLDLPVGVLVLASVLLGCVLAGLILYAAVIVPLRMRLGSARREIGQRKIEQSVIEQRKAVT